MKTPLEREEEEELEGELGQGMNKARQANYILLKKQAFSDGGQEKNGLLPWNTAERTGEWSRKNESVKNLEGNLETILPYYRSEASNSFLLLIEDDVEDFDSEFSLFNELPIPSNLISSPHYLPYYRTYEEFFINPVSLDTLCVGAEMEDSDIGGEKRDRGSSCKANTIREDENPSHIVISSGYFPYYRSYEEYFGHPVLNDGLSMPAEGKEANPRNNERGSICEVAVGRSDESISQSYETKREGIFSMPGVGSSGSFLLTDSIAGRCASEISLLNELLMLNQRFSSTGYFPYYRTYGELLFSPAPHDGYSISTDAQAVVISETAEKSRWDFSGSCAVC